MATSFWEAAVRMAIFQFDFARVAAEKLLWEVSAHSPVHRFPERLCWGGRDEAALGSSWAHSHFLELCGDQVLLGGASGAS